MLTATYVFGKYCITVTTTEYFSELFNLILQTSYPLWYQLKFKHTPKPIFLFIATANFLIFYFFPMMTEHVEFFKNQHLCHLQYFMFYVNDAFFSQ